MNAVDWLVVDSKNKLLERHLTRQHARESKKWYHDNMFQEWMDDVKYPVKIIREEWELKDRKVVR